MEWLQWCKGSFNNNNLQITEKPKIETWLLKLVIPVRMAKKRNLLQNPGKTPVID